MLKPWCVKNFISIYELWGWGFEWYIYTVPFTFIQHIYFWFIGPLNVWCLLCALWRLLCVCVHLLQIYQRKSEMNTRVLALRNSKVELISSLRSLRSELLTLQMLLPVEKRHPPPSVPTLLPEETPERKMRYSRATLQRFAVLRDQVGRSNQEDEQVIFKTSKPSFSYAECPSTNCTQKQIWAQIWKTLQHTY